MPAPLVLGVDSSTQSTKAELRRLEDGAVVASAKAPHPATTPPVSEQDPEMWWQALSNAVSKLGDHRSDVVAMSIAGQQHGLVLLDDQQLPIRPAKL
ncbi:MAG: FGGY family carbohydrate kinase, partial [Ilumatobacteraceae bacterium]